MEEPEATQRTFWYATHYIHGLTPDQPGLPYHSWTDAVTLYLKAQVYHHLEQQPNPSDGPPLLFCKGDLKSSFLQAPIPTTGVLATLEVLDLQEYGCP